MDTPWGEVHASMLTLLKGPVLQDEAFKESTLPARLQVGGLWSVAL